MTYAWRDARSSLFRSPSRILKRTLSDELSQPLFYDATIKGGIVLSRLPLPMLTAALLFPACATQAQAPPQASSRTRAAAWDWSRYCGSKLGSASSVDTLRTTRKHAWAAIKDDLRPAASSSRPRRRGSQILKMNSLPSLIAVMRSGRCIESRIEPTLRYQNSTSSTAPHGSCQQKVRHDIIFGKDRCIDAVGKYIKLSEAFARTAQFW